MTNWWRMAAAATAAGCMLAGTAAGQSGSGSGSSASSPFSGLFSRGDPVANSPVDLQFRVTTGDEDLERRLRNTSRITGALVEGRYTAQDVLAAARADYSRLLGLLYDEGFYDSIVEIRLDGVEAAGIAPLDAPEIVRQVVVTVDPGQAFRYSRAEIAPVARGTELPEDYRVGEIARTSDMRTAARAGVTGWRDQGHAKAEVAATEIIADHEIHRVESRIALSPGPQVRFGQLRATGNQRLSTRRLYKIAGFPEGERFDPETLEEVRRRLRRTGVFSSITLEEAETLGPGNTLDVNLTVLEQRLRRIGGGFEISSTDGALISGYWMHRNLLGGGERLRVDAEAKDIGSGTSGRDYRLGVRIDRPATITPDITASVEARAERLREEDYDLDLGVLGFGLTWLPSERLTGQTTLEYRRSRVRDDTGITDFEILALPTSVTWDRRDEPTDAKRGYWLTATGTPFYGLNEAGSGLRLVGEGRAYRSFGTDNRFTLAARARAGSIWGSDIAETPREFLFYSGGGGSVRGQPYESLGVRVIEGPDGVTVKTGGMSVANLTAEARVQVRPRIGVVAFADAGRVWADSSFEGQTDWHAGAGLGVRYNTPIGPLRLDVAGPVGGDTGEGVQLYLGLGQAF
ncbi:autotransporter assembly complex protein TamA [Paracoccus chinensis]|uniref:Autotransporter secretion outer membrane protein TamA n=1 Tax=Paracoccus chinensis TaxID=525640 RepID=A0A1G9C9T0_9RHOB|nr:BamA/TamA family outer membrane protein [Paracoccus chinensis]SDK48423.1 autotransporter secretion outer membrane protein TamA [Paracoccus chinensis]